MHIVSNQRRIHFHRILATVTSLIGVVLLAVSLLLPVARPSTSTTPPLWLVVVAVAVSSLGLRLSSYWLRPPTPHEALDQGLKGFGSEYALYHYSLPAPHVLVCPQGIFTLTTKPQRAAVRVEGEAWSRMESTLTQLISVIARQDSIGNPSLAARRQAKKLQTWLDKQLPGHSTQVQSMVVFSSPEATLNVHQPNTPAVYANKRKPSLKTAIRNLPKRATLTAEQIATLERAAGIAPHA